MKEMLIKESVLPNVERSVKSIVNMLQVKGEDFEQSKTNAIGYLEHVVETLKNIKDD